MKKSVRVLIVCLFLLMGIVAYRQVGFSPRTNTAPSIRPDQNIPVEITLEGEYVCLPHRDQSVPVTLECAFGMRADDGSYYALDAGAIPSSVMQVLPIGQRVRVSGLLVPIEQISTNTWQKYDIEGIMKVKTLEKM